MKNGRSMFGIRHNRGSMLFEAAVSLLIMIPCLGLCLNAIFGLMAYESLDWACRDAARAAAQALSDPQNIGSPSALAQQAANAAIQAHSLGPGKITATLTDYSFIVTDVTSPSPDKDTNNFYLCDRTGKPTSNHEGPSVTIQAQLTYKLPFPVICFGNQISADRQTITLQQIYSYPILVPTLIIPDDPTPSAG